MSNAKNVNIAVAVKRTTKKLENKGHKKSPSLGGANTQGDVLNKL